MSDRLVLMLIAYSPLILAIIWGIHFAIQANQRDKERDAIALIKFNNTKWIKAIILQHSLAD